MSEELTPRQQILLWDLISRGGSALLMDLKPKVEPKDREPLVRAKIVSVVKDGRALRLTVDEAGWNWLSSTPPTLLVAGGGSKYDRPVLQFVLLKLQTYAMAQQVSLATILAPTAKDAKPIFDEIRDAFYRLAGKPARNYVRLRALRVELKHVARETLDRELIKLWHDKVIDLSTLSNPPDIMKEEDAPLRIGSAIFHTVWVHP